MYKNNTVHELGFNNNFLGYSTNRDPWKQLTLSRLIITTENNDRITERQLGNLYYHEYNRKISNDTAIDKNIKLKLKYNKNGKSENTRGLFVCVRIRPATNPNITLNELQKTNPLEIQQL